MYCKSYTTKNKPKKRDVDNKLIMEIKYSINPKGNKKRWGKWVKQMGQIGNQWYIGRLKHSYVWGTWLAQPGKHAILDLRAMSLNPTLGIRLL